jgi:hypothetical protein
LVADVKVEVAPSARAFNILTDTTGIIDPKQPIYNIRGSYTAYQCWNLASATPGQFPPGKSCSSSNVTWVMHTKSTPRDDSARLVAGRQ